MRIYQDVFEMHSEVNRDIHEMGIMVHPHTMQDKVVRDDDAYSTLELSPCTFTLLSGEGRVEWLKRIGFSVEYYDREREERWAALRGLGLNPGSAWKLRANVWEEFLHDGAFSYTYSERFARNNALVRVLEELSGNPDTRQAILPIFQGDVDTHRAGGKSRIPCSMFYQFLIRHPDGLRLYYQMRSSDFVTHFPFDIALALDFQERVANDLGVKAGMFVFFTGSLHIYKKDFDATVF